MDANEFKDVADILAHALAQKETLKSVLRALEESHSRNVKLVDLYDDYLKQVTDLESKLKEAQKIYYHERQKLNASIKERNKLAALLNSAREIVSDENYIMNNKTREKLSFLNNPPENLGLEKLDTILELDSTDVMMSDISYTLGEDEISVDSSLRRSSRQKRAPCRFPSDESLEAVQPKRSKGSQATKYKADRDEQVIATTTVTVPHRGPVTAKSTIETMPSSSHILRQRVEPQYKPSAPPITLLDTDSDSGSSGNNRMYRAPFACQTNLRLHDWNQKARLMGETCSGCCKKIKFSTVASKCSNCKAVVHTSCQSHVPLPCVPVAVNTPNAKSSKAGYIWDFVPLTTPMVPSIVVHCIREIEARGFSEVGLYRVPGSDKEVKTLKEKLLKGKGIIDISNVADIHTVCGCLKEFLRSLKEPLIPQSQWRELAQASDIQDGEQKKNRIFNFVQALPQANRDTLAYLVLHLQRVAAAPHCKMPVANLSKMFGPNVVGYSKNDPDNILMETNISNKIMADLLLMPTECWEATLHPDLNENLNPDLVKTPSQNSLFNFFSSSTSSVKTVKRGRKFFDTP